MGTPTGRVKHMVKSQPSLIMRSTAKLLTNFKICREITKLPVATAASLAERRPSLLTQKIGAAASCYKALSIWKMSREDKWEILRAHPSLLTMNGSELHFRCRWLRQLILSNGIFHR